LQRFQVSGLSPEEPNFVSTLEQRGPGLIDLVIRSAAA